MQNVPKDAKNGLQKSYRFQLGSNTGTVVLYEVDLEMKKKIFELMSYHNIFTVADLLNKLVNKEYTLKETQGES